MNALTFQIYLDCVMTLVDPAGGFDLARLQKITGGSSDPGQVASVGLFDHPDESGGELVLARSDFQVRAMDAVPHFRVEAPLPVSDLEKCGLWQTAMLFGWTSLVLQGKPVLPIHGTLLETKDRQGVLLCAASGVGKSTTARRWRAVGGICRADDMILLDLSGDGILAHPLPTWSSCRETIQDKFYPVETAIPVKTILALDRAEKKEEIREVSPLFMASTLYFACTLFEQEILLKLPEKDQKIVSRRIKEVAAYLNRKFAPRALFAHLDGDLSKLEF